MPIRKQRRILAPFEIAAIFVKSKMLYPDYTLLYEFYLLTGCRPSEPLNLQWRDIDLYGMSIKLMKTDSQHKRRLLRKIYLPSHIQLQLLHLTGQKGPFPYKLESVRNAFNRIVKSIPLNNVRLQTLRDTFQHHLAIISATEDSPELAIEQVQQLFLPDIQREPPPNGLAKLLKEGKL